MQYFGGKQRISKTLSGFLNTQLKEGQPFVDAFCGSCNIISKIDNNRVRIANDKHKYLIAMWKCLQEGWLPPTNITKEEYAFIKANKEANESLTGFVGFGCSFAGKWFGGYASSADRNYCKNANNSTMKKLKTLTDVTFTNTNYNDIQLPTNSLIYCDIPYKDTTAYCKAEVGVFDHELFYSWCQEQIENGHTILVSEYLQNVPKGAKVVWSHNSKKDIRDKEGIQQPTTEVLFTW